MRILSACATAFLLVLSAASPAANTGRPRPGAPQIAPIRLDNNYGRLPLAFEPNLGQTAPEVRFLARGGGMMAFFTDAETVMVLGGSEQAVVRMKLAGAMKPRQATGLETLPGISNYFIGNDPKKWRTDVPHYARIEYQGVYPGIDLVWYGNQRQLEYDFVVGPGADAKQIQVAYEGVESVNVEANGELVLRTALGEVRQQQPRVYQEIGGKRAEVGARYAIVARNRVSFELAKYDRKRELRIDPVVLVYSTYLGGSGANGDDGKGIAVDAAGSAYVTGTTHSTDFPIQSPYLPTYQGGTYDAYVTKLTPAGNALVYSTYLGGNGRDDGFGIAVDGAGSAYVSGLTTSTNFPTQSAYQATLHGTSDGFVTKLTPAGNALVYSTYLGGSGSDYCLAITVDPAGSAYVTGVTQSTDFPTQSAYQATSPGGGDAFVTKLTPAGNALAYSTYLGGSGWDSGYGIAVDGAGSAYVTGETQSTDFPTQLAYRATAPGGFDDAFVTKLTPAGNALAYSTYLGGSDIDVGKGIAVDWAGSAYVTGNTYSANFPTQSPYQATRRGTSDVFVTKLAPAGNALAYSTYLGGDAGEVGEAIAVDGDGSAYVTGYTASSNFPTKLPYQTEFTPVTNAFVTKLMPAGDALSYSTCLHGGIGNLGTKGLGIAVDAAGSAYVAGWTGASDFPTQSPYQAAYGGGMEDAFVTKLKLDLQLPATVVASDPTGAPIIVDGVNLFAPQTFEWAPGTVHSIGAISPVYGGATRYVFANWSDDGAQTHSITASSSATTYTANFSPAYHLASAVSPPAGGTVTANPTSPDGYYITGSSVQLTAHDYPDYRFDHWSGDLTGSVNPQSVTMSATRSVTAVFAQVSGTAIATNPAGLAIVVDSVNQTAPQNFSWASGTLHSVGAVSPQYSGGARYVFTNWSDGGAQTHSITTPSSATTYTATFSTAYPLTVTASPTVGGTVTVSPTSPDGYYNIGSSVQLTAIANPGYRLGGWSGDLTGTANPQSVVMSARRIVDAYFVPGGPVINAVLDSASGLPAIAPNSFVTIYGSGFTSWTGDWSGSAPNGMLPTTLGGVQVRIDGKDCFVNYVSSSQLNVVTPFDAASGSVSVEVLTTQGTATATAVMAQIAPALFGYTVANKFYAVAQFANTGILVAPSWMFGSGQSRPAQAGDYLTLWAIGMGSTNPAAPAGQVLLTAYPVTDLSRVKVKFGSVDATVSWAGLVYAGEFQVNVLVPPGLSGDQPVIMTVDGQSTQPNAFLNFQ